MRKMFFLGVLLSVMSIQAAQFDYVQAYRKGGIKAIEAQVEKELASSNYWLEFLKNYDVRWGYYESIEFVFIANKKSSTLKLYQKNQDGLKERYNLDSLMGSKPGDKMVEGDLKTPIGAYDLTARLTKLDQFYGPLAYVTSYPNTYDRVQKKTGYGIWIHGLPFNGDREINTRGCIAINNDKLNEIDEILNHKDAILITEDGALKETTKNQVATLLSGLFTWRKAWQDNDLNTYLDFYDKDEFKRFDRMPFQEFSEYKKRVFLKKEAKNIDFSKINVAPYPNEKGEEFFKISFYEKYRASGGYRFEGNKELYVKIKNNQMKIVAEK